MNKIYKLVWSKTRNMYIAVCEFAKSYTKAPKSGGGVMSRALVAGVLACALSFGAVVSSALAATVPVLNSTTTDITWDSFKANYNYLVTDIDSSYFYFWAIKKSDGTLVRAYFAPNATSGKLSTGFNTSGLASSSSFLDGVTGLVMKGATSSAAGAAGTVPAPAAGKQNMFLRGDGTWATPTDTNTTYSAATSSALGLVKVGSNITNSSGTISLTKANVTSALGYTPPTSDTNTHYTSHMYVGSGTAANAATTNGNTKIALVDDSTVRNTLTIKGTGKTTVTSDANGVITINSTDANTTYSAATTSSAGLMSAADKTKLDGISSGANAYSLPAATSSALGGVKVGSNITNSSGTISLTKANVTAALGYTPPTTDTNTTYSAFTGATSSAAGGAGLVKAPAAGDQNKFLRGDGTWATDNNTTYAAMTASELTTGTATTSRSITAKVLGDYVSGKTNDKISGLSVSGKTITYTKGDGTTGTITTQDTTYSNMSASELSTGTATTARSISAKTVSDFVTGKVSTETTNRTNADTALSNRIGTISDNGNYVKS